MNVHLLPKRIMRAWIGYSDPMNNQEALFNLGAWALTNKLDMSSPSEPGEQVAPAPAAGIIHPTKDDEEADKTDNEEIGAFDLYSSTMSAGRAEQTEVKDTMDYNVNTRTWVVTDTVSDFTCKSTTNVLMEGVTPQLFACHNKKRCPRCAAQVNIKDGYEDPELYKANARYLIDELSKYRDLIEAEERRQELVNCSFSWILIIAKAVRHDKSVSYFGAIPLPARFVEAACRSNRLTSYYVERRWRDPESMSLAKGFEYCLAMDPGNNHLLRMAQDSATKEKSLGIFPRPDERK